MSDIAKQHESQTARADALAETVRALRDVVFMEHESKQDFIARVRAILSADPDARVSSVRQQLEEAQRKLNAEDVAHSNTLEQRDRAEKAADELAKAVSKHFRVDIGEHSSANDPWQEALSVIDGEYETDSDQDREIVALKAERRLAEAQGQEPVFWYRPADTGGGYEGPIHDRAMEQVRKDSGKWIPLYTHLAPASDERVKELAARLLEHDGGEGSRCYSASVTYETRADLIAALAASKGGV